MSQTQTQRAAALVATIMNGDINESAEAADQLIALLVETEDLTPELADTAYEDGEGYDFVVLVHRGGETHVYQDGRVDHFPN